MLRIQQMQQKYGIKDPAMKDALIEVSTMKEYRWNLFHQRQDPLLVNISQLMAPTQEEHIGQENL